MQLIATDAVIETPIASHLGRLHKPSLIFARWAMILVGAIGLAAWELWQMPQLIELYTVYD